MKNICKFKIVSPSGKIVVDKRNPLFQSYDLMDIVSDLIPYTKLFDEIVIKNFYSIPAELLNKLTVQYLHGAKITVECKNFSKTYQVSGKIPAFYNYYFEELDLSAPVPKSLAEFEFDYLGSRVTYLNAIKSLTSTKFLPSEIWTALDTYNQSRIDKCREFNKGDYSLAEQWYKALLKDCKLHNIAVFSPNKKTYYEAMAEIEFNKECEQARLKDGLRPLNAVELAFLQKYHKAYGVEIPTFDFRFNTRKTKDGYTQEPERVLNGMSNSDWSLVIYDPRNRDNLPKNIRSGLKVQSCANDKFIRDAYFQLKWIMKHLKDDGLMPNYHRCPKCHQIYQEHEGCECGYCQPIEFIQADNLLYGISSTYEDYGYTKDLYGELD